ncbi:M23 family metallopeptidase [Candidatus Peregrinibacteria bacterium]|nr:M23 family metallopeptidase [Candidatus Peregrinibacteria bacterium]
MISSPSGKRRFILCPSLINRNKVNIEAQHARHAKLETQNTVHHSVPITPVRKSFFSWLIEKLQKLIGVGSENSGISRLIRKMVAISVVFFVLSSFGPMYNLTEGNYGYFEEYSFIDFASEATDSILKDIMTEDGFILKPALNSTEGDRSTANEIFAYEVEPGDTISSLAQRFGIKKETIAMENDLWNTNQLKTGMVLKILPVDGVSHVVKKGDTVDKIAKKYEVEAADIIRQNQLEEGETLLADSALIIPGGKKSITVPAIYNNSAPATAIAYSYSGGGTGRLIWPTLGAAKITQGFHSGHYAIDIGNRAKGPIFAAAAGRVVKASYGWGGGYGNHVIIDHGNGMQTLYAHNEKLYVTEGQYVDQGQTIAWMGRSGRVYGPTGIHLHFEVRINGVKYNPMNFF